MSTTKVLMGHVDYPVWKRFTVDETKPAVKVTWGMWFDGVVGGEFAEMDIFIYSADWSSILATGYTLHNAGPAGIFEKVDKLYHGAPKINSGNNHSDYDNTPFTAGQEIIVYFRAAKEQWNNYKFGVAYAAIEMSD